MMNVLIIANPMSGKKKTKIILDTIVLKTLVTNNISYKIHLTEFPLHARELINKVPLKNYNFILVLGGDGTMHEVIDGMLDRDDDSNIPIGLLATGSGNSLLHDRGNTNIDTSLQKILKYKITNIDVLKVKTPENIFYSLNLVGWGMVNDISVRAENNRWMGPMRYNISSLIEIFQCHPKYVDFEIDGNSYKGKYTFIIACNTKHVGKGMKMAPNAKLNDGKMDLIIIKDNFKKIKLLKMFPKIFNGSHIHDKIVNYKQAKEIKIIPKSHSTINIDGEIKGRTPISIKVLPGKIKLLN